MLFEHLKHIAYLTIQLGHLGKIVRQLLTDDRRIGVSMHFMPTDTGQIVGDWDSASLVRGKDTYGNFTVTPIPAHDFDEEAVAFHARAAKAIHGILYSDAKEDTAKL